MNVDRIRKLADLIEGMQHIGDGAADKMFSMPVWADRHDCGTAACIVGWAALSAGRPAWGLSALAVQCTACEWLGLDTDRAEDLAYAHGFDGDLEDITPARAARTLRHLADTGEVKWT